MIAENMSIILIQLLVMQVKHLFTLSEGEMEIIMYLCRVKNKMPLMFYM